MNTTDNHDDATEPKDLTPAETVALATGTAKEIDDIVTQALGR